MQDYQAKYYDANREVILKKKAEQYQAKKEKRLADIEAGLITPVPRKKKVKKPKTIWDACELREGIYRRRGDAPRPIKPFNPDDNPKKIKHNELLWILEGVTDTSFNYNKDEWEGDVWQEEDSSMCLCSQTVKHNFIITHKPSNKKFIVGCECVKNICPEFYKYILSSKCEICGNVVNDKRTKHGREGYCSKECMPMKFPMGRHKGVRLNRLPLDYIQWCLETLERPKFNTLLDELEDLGI